MEIENVMTFYGYGKDFDSNDLVEVLRLSYSNGNKEAVATILKFTGGLIPLWNHLHK